MHKIRISRAATWILLTAMTLTGCAVQLAPRYDAVLFESLISVNPRIMELFASVAQGTSEATFDQREASYNSLIGIVDALALQSKARPVPESELSDKINEILRQRGMDPGDDGVPPSAHALDEVSQNLAKMKEVDKASGLRPLAVAAFKNAVVISMDQAITYESFLNR